MSCYLTNIDIENMFTVVSSPARGLGKGRRDFKIRNFDQLDNWLLGNPTPISI